MFTLEAPWWEMVLRAALIYCALMFGFRMIGKKQLGQMSPFDLVLLLIISEGVSNGLTGRETSLIGALITAATLLFLSYAIDFIAFKFHSAEKFLEGRPHLLIHQGKVFEDVRKKFKITMTELEESLREHQIGSLEDVESAIIETNGRITAISKKDQEK